MPYNFILKSSGFVIAGILTWFTWNRHVHQPPSLVYNITGSKELYIPAKDSNDYKDNNSVYSFQRKVESDNIAIFWAKEFGEDPMLNPDTAKRFDVKAALEECERFYNFYVDKLKIVQKGKSLTDKYKMLLYVVGGNDQTAYGGGEENKVGMLWTPAVRMHRAPYGALAHELGHAFQYLAAADNGRNARGAVMEMSAQYMLWQVYPEWMTFENYHLVSFMKKTHFAFLHPTNMYHSPYVLEYWSGKHGIDFFGKMLHEVNKGEDFVATYKRITGITQEQFNDEMFDASRRFITWDLARISGLAAKYSDQHRTTFTAGKDGWFIIADTNCLQNYGYNGVRLTVPALGKTIKVDFKGIAGADGFRKIKTDKAGWRYGFVAHKTDGSRVYSDTFKNGDATVSFNVPGDTRSLWLVVSGAPTEHSPVSGNDQNNEQWPYKLRFHNTALY